MKIENKTSIIKQLETLDSQALISLLDKFNFDEDVSLNDRGISLPLDTIKCNFSSPYTGRSQRFDKK